jgi:hypothetical protein
MVFQSSSGIEQNKKVQLVLAIILIALICGFFIYTRSMAPKKDAVDGVYRNGCCSDIVVQNGRVSYGSAALDMKLLNMKFGLTGYVDGQFTSQGIQAASEPTAITFADQGGKRTLSLPIDRQDRIFERAEESGSKAR